MALDRFSVLDPLNDETIVVEAVDHEDAAAIAVQKWNSAEGFLRDGEDHDVEVTGPMSWTGTLSNRTWEPGGTCKRFSVTCSMEPTYYAHEYPASEYPEGETKKEG
jgi:hypothetical protein